MMKTLVINGSPKKNGDTTALINEFIKHLEGEVKILSYFDDIQPCSDCRYCWSNNGCSIDDKMQVIYPFLDECDNVVIASPIWFSSLSGIVLNIASRVQTLFCGRYFRNIVKETTKNGVILLVGAQKETDEIPKKMALTIMRHMYVRRPCVAEVYSLDTNNIPACEDKNALNNARKAALLLNNLYINKREK